MGLNTGVHWADDSFNPGIGCYKIKPECENCYAATIAERFSKGVEWKKGGARYIVKGWRKIVSASARLAAKEGRRRRVFVWDMGDIGEAWEREDLRDLALEALRLPIAYPGLDFLYLTKRPRGLEELSYFAYDDRPGCAFPDNAWVGVTCGHPASYESVDILRGMNVRTMLVSAEPLLAPLPDLNLRGIDWVIVGGESGAKARVMKLDWVNDVYQEARKCGTAFFFKQMGCELARTFRLKDSAGGDFSELTRLGYPFMVREYPGGISK